ncbi:hypothetical protein GCM10020331_023090 [Ectobacillus funiculus]
MNILYLEDDTEIGRWVKSDLESRGYTVEWYTSGLELPHHLEQYDLMILDIMLPGLDGFFPWAGD